MKIKLWLFPVLLVPLFSFGQMVSVQVELFYLKKYLNLIKNAREFSKDDSTHGVVISAMNSFLEAFGEESQAVFRFGSSEVVHQRRDYQINIEYLNNHYSNARMVDTALELDYMGSYQLALITRVNVRYDRQNEQFTLGEEVFDEEREESDDELSEDDIEYVRSSEQGTHIEDYRAVPVTVLEGSNERGWNLTVYLDFEERTTVELYEQVRAEQALACPEGQPATDARGLYLTAKTLRKASDGGSKRVKKGGTQPKTGGGGSSSKHSKEEKLIKVLNKAATMRNRVGGATDESTRDFFEAMQ